ncbi:MAG TPA: hypothetical protein VG605_17210 [Puia sp.]|nr:hypothetical protein [Puia sp.]
MNWWWKKRKKKKSVHPEDEWPLWEYVPRKVGGKIVMWPRYHTSKGARRQSPF